MTASSVPRAVPPQPGRLAAVVARALGALPAALVFAPVWAAATVACVCAAALSRDVGWTPRLAEVIATFAAGGGLGGLLAVIAAEAVAGTKAPSARFAAVLIALIVATGGALLAVYATAFRLSDAEFWSDFPEPIFAVELAFTMASAAYTLAVSGLPLLLPHGLVPLLAAAFWFARRGD